MDSVAGASIGTSNATGRVAGRRFTIKNVTFDIAVLCGLTMFSIAWFMNNVRNPVYQPLHTGPLTPSNFDPYWILYPGPLLMIVSIVWLLATLYYDFQAISWAQVVFHIFLFFYDCICIGFLTRDALQCGDKTWCAAMKDYTPTPSGPNIDYADPTYTGALSNTFLASLLIQIFVTVALHPLMAIYSLYINYKIRPDVIGVQAAEDMLITGLGNSGQSGDEERAVVIQIAETRRMWFTTGSDALSVVAAVFTIALGMLVVRLNIYQPRQAIPLSVDSFQPYYTIVFSVAVCFWLVIAQPITVYYKRIFGLVLYAFSSALPFLYLCYVWAQAIFNATHCADALWCADINNYMINSPTTYDFSYNDVAHPEYVRPLFKGYIVLLTVMILLFAAQGVLSCLIHYGYYTRNTLLESTNPYRRIESDMAGAKHQKGKKLRPTDHIDVSGRPKSV